MFTGCILTVRELFKSPPYVPLLEQTNKMGTFNSKHTSNFHIEKVELANIGEFLLQYKHISLTQQPIVCADDMCSYHDDDVL